MGLFYCFSIEHRRVFYTRSRKRGELVFSSRGLQSVVVTILERLCHHRSAFISIQSANMSQSTPKE